MRPHAKALLILCLLTFLGCRFASAQSFDCGRATTKVEQAICKSDDLKTLDAGMGDAYKGLLAASTERDKSSVMAAQKDWIEKRDRQCTTAGADPLEKCLTESITRRRDDLTAQLRKLLGLSPMAFDWIHGYSYSLTDIPDHAHDVRDHFGSCRQIPPGPGSKVTALARSGYQSLYGIATHRCDAVLRVFLRCASATDTDQCNELLIWEDLSTGQPRMMGELQPEHRTGNSGGIFVPIAFTRDDHYVILKAWMGDPGAGGSFVNYGYEIMPRDQGTSNRTALAPAGAIFYDDFGKAVYTEDSKNLPTYVQPGPRSNDGLIVVKDLATLKTASVLEQPDTTFEILKADEKNHWLIVRFTHHTFSQGCPRDQEDSLHCTKKTVREGHIPLP